MGGIAVALLATACADQSERAQAPAQAVTPPAASSQETNRRAPSGDYEVRLQNGQKYYCRTDRQTGSRLMTATTCLTEQQYTMMQDEMRQGMDRFQGAPRPNGRTSASGGAN
jgi:hypothetical protein